MAFEQNPVSRAVWPWVRAADKPDAAVGRIQRAVLQAALMVGVGLLLHFFPRAHPHPVAGNVLFVLAGVLLVIGLAFPGIFAALERAAAAFGRGVGAVTNVLLLVPFYYLFFTPGRLLLRLRGRDPLRRAFQPGAASYWIPRPPVRDLNSYRRQH